MNPGLHRYGGENVLILWLFGLARRSSANDRGSGSIIIILEEAKSLAAKLKYKRKFNYCTLFEYLPWPK
jgi:hypothetical protein